MYPFLVQIISAEQTKQIKLPNVAYTIAHGLFTLVGLLLLNWGLWSVVEATGLNQEHSLSDPYSGKWRTPLILLIAPVIEEFAFRGWLLAHMQKRWPFLLAIIINGVLFALLHSFNVISWAFLWPLVSGLFFAGVTVYHRAWGVTCIAHLMYNGITIAFHYL